MTDLRAALLAHLDGLVAGCRHAMPQTAQVMTEGPAIAAHIAGHSPSVMEPVWEGLAADVRAHEYEDINLGGYPCKTCPACRGVGDGLFEGDACPFVRRWAARLGVSPEPDAPGGCGHDEHTTGFTGLRLGRAANAENGAWEPCPAPAGGSPEDGGASEQTGDGERGTPAGHGESEGSDRSNGPAAVATGTHALCACCGHHRRWNESAFCRACQDPIHACKRPPAASPGTAERGGR